MTRLLALLPPSPRVVDLGAGTGHLAEPLARAGARVVAVEPTRAMLKVCAERTGEVEVELVEAPAEATGLPGSVADGVVLADAAQWVDPEAAGKEAHRLLRRGGMAIAVEPRAADTPFMRALESLVRQANPERRPAGPGRARQWLALASGGTRVRTLELFQSVELTPAMLEGILRSLSFLAPALGLTRMETLLEEARTLAAQHGGGRWERALQLSWARKSIRQEG